MSLKKIKCHNCFVLFETTSGEKLCNKCSFKKENGFQINLLKGKVAFVIVEHLFKFFDYKAFPYGYEYFIDEDSLSKVKTSKSLNTMKLRSNPDMVVINKNELIPIEIKSVFSKHQENFKMRYDVFKRYIEFWPESICLIFHFHSFKMYAKPFKDIEYTMEKEYAFINYTKTFSCLSEFFPDMEKKELISYLENVRENFGLVESKKEKFLS